MERSAQGSRSDPTADRLARALTEMGRTPLLDLADEMSEESDRRRLEEGDPATFIEQFADFLQKRKHAFIGGIAVRTYLRQRPTDDLDVMVDASAWDDARRFVSSEHGESVGQVGETTTYEFPDFTMEVDIRVARSPLDIEALDGAVERPFKGRRLKVVHPNHLVAMKVRAFSERKQQPGGDQDRKDVRRLFTAALASEASVRDILERLRPDLVPELNELLARD